MNSWKLLGMEGRRAISISLVEQDFGAWVKRVRDRSGATQNEFAQALGLKSYAAVRLIERRPGRSVRGRTLEGLIEIVGAGDERRLDEMWQNGELPDPHETWNRITARVALLQARLIATPVARRTMPVVKEAARSIGKRRGKKKS